MIEYILNIQKKIQDDWKELVGEMYKYYDLMICTNTRFAKCYSCNEASFMHIEYQILMMVLQTFSTMPLIVTISDKEKSCRQIADK